MFRIERINFIFQNKIAQIQIINKTINLTELYYSYYCVTTCQQPVSCTFALTVTNQQWVGITFVTRPQEVIVTQLQPVVLPCSCLTIRWGGSGPLVGRFPSVPLAPPPPPPSS